MKSTQVTSTNTLENSKECQYSSKLTFSKSINKLRSMKTNIFYKISLLRTNRLTLDAFQLLSYGHVLMMFEKLVQCIQHVQCTK